MVCILKKEVSIGDIVELQFIRATRGYISRSDEGVLVLIDKTHPIWPLLMRKRPNEFILRAKVTRLVRKNDQIRAVIVWPLETPPM